MISISLLFNSDAFSVISIGGIEKGEPFVIALPHLVLHYSTEFFTRDVQAENLIIKRKYSTLNTDHVHLRQEQEVLKQKQAKLEYTVGNSQHILS